MARAIYLTESWAGRDAGTRFWVLGPDDDLKRAHVDEGRAEQLLAGGLATEEKDDGPVPDPNPEPEEDAAEIADGPDGDAELLAFSSEFDDVTEEADTDG